MPAKPVFGVPQILDVYLTPKSKSNIVITPPPSSHDAETSRTMSPRLKQRTTTPNVPLARDIPQPNSPGLSQKPNEPENAVEIRAEKVIAITPAVPRISASAVLDAARSLAREEERKLAPSQAGSPSLSERPASPEIARILAKKEGKSSVTQQADGSVKVITAYGTVYCMQPPPGFTLGGPAPAMYIPMTCP
jgi:hypothetical protein